jgi:hypothetical protein
MPATHSLTLAAAQADVDDLRLEVMTRMEGISGRLAALIERHAAAAAAGTTPSGPLTATSPPIAGFVPAHSAPHTAAPAENAVEMPA